jgi:tetratricopeptide (TPR) repeat protein
LDGFLLDPRDARAFNNRGVTYADLEQFEKAIQDYNQAIELNPKDFNALASVFLDCLTIISDSNLTHSS